MKTFEEHNKITIHDLIVGFYFIEAKDFLYYYNKNHNMHNGWIFYYNKSSEKIILDPIEYNNLNTGLEFDDFVEPLKLNFYNKSI